MNQRYYSLDVFRGATVCLMILVKEKEIQTIRRFLNEHENVEAVKTEIQLNDDVIITAGPMMDKEGKVLEIKNKMVKVSIESLGYTLIAHIDKNKLASVTKILTA